MRLEEWVESRARIQRPTPLGILTEWRFVPEAMSWLSAMHKRWPHPESGQGRVVLFLPGFLAGDVSLAPMASFCSALGHRTEFSGIISNVSCPTSMLEFLTQRLQRLNAQYDQPVTIVGHSLGGLYARQLAHRYPELVEQVITMGSPLHAPTDSCHFAVHALVNTLDLLRPNHHSCLSGTCGSHFSLEHNGPLPVPVTIIYSPIDGVVHWESCIDRLTFNARHVEHRTSHCGMAVSPQVFATVAETLASAPPHRASSLRLVQRRI